MDEFELIRRYFSTQTVQRDDVLLGIGDDAAILRAPSGQDLVVSTDTLIAGTHFPVDMAADAIGHRVLAAKNMAVSGNAAQPAWALLALSLPATDEKWLQGFARGFSRAG